MIEKKWVLMFSKIKEADFHMAIFASLDDLKTCINALCNSWGAKYDILPEINEWESNLENMADNTRKFGTGTATEDDDWACIYIAECTAGEIV